MPVFIVTHTKSEEFVVAVEAKTSKDAEECVAEAAEAGFLAYEPREYTDEVDAEPADESEGPTYRANHRERRLERIAIPVPK